jgi:hypothetical protein
MTMSRVFLILVLVPLISGFDLSRTIVPKEDILAGGPPKDGIPALSSPKIIPSEAASSLSPSDQVIGVSLNGESRAYLVCLAGFPS